MTSEITHDRTRRRFETRVDGEVGMLDYALDGATMVILHVVVPAAIGGRGIASALTKAALDSARAEGLRVVPQCPFAASYVHAHPEYADIVVES